MAVIEIPFSTISATTISYKSICATTFKSNSLEEMMLIDTPKSGSNYHHGNVKEALLTAAQNHIENNQCEKISLRALSKEVGITPSAVYNHFADKDALLLAIKIRIFQNLNRFLHTIAKKLRTLKRLWQKCAWPFPFFPRISTLTSIHLQLFHFHSMVDR